MLHLSDHGFVNLISQESDPQIQYVLILGKLRSEGECNKPKMNTMIVHKIHSG